MGNPIKTDSLFKTCNPVKCVVLFLSGTHRATVTVLRGKSLGVKHHVTYLLFLKKPAIRFGYLHPQVSTIRVALFVGTKFSPVNVENEGGRWRVGVRERVL